jgi:hypothetical protein
LVIEAILETKAETVLPFIHSLRGCLHVTFEQGTSAAFLYTFLKPHVTRVLVCDPRQNARLKVGTVRANSPNCCARIFCDPSFMTTPVRERERKWRAAI